MATFLVTGGTGTLGRLVVARLREAGQTVRVLSRHGEFRVDLRNGKGLAEAVAGVDVVVHCASGISGDVAAGDNLIAAAKAAAVKHLVYISIVGVDQVDYGYYNEKLEVERRLAKSGLSYTILRTTQFHNLVYRLLRAAAKSPVMFVPGISVQPIEVEEVAARLTELALGPPAWRVADMGGPVVRNVAELAREYLRHAGKRRAIVPMWLPGKAFAGYRRGGHLARGAAVGTGTFEVFLARQPK